MLRLPPGEIDFFPFFQMKSSRRKTFPRPMFIGSYSLANRDFFTTDFSDNNVGRTQHKTLVRTFVYRCLLQFLRLNGEALTHDPCAHACS